jgi:hypothetical protein
VGHYFHLCRASLRGAVRRAPELPVFVLDCFVLGAARYPRELGERRFNRRLRHRVAHRDSDRRVAPVAHLSRALQQLERATG